MIAAGSDPMATFVLVTRPGWASHVPYITRPRDVVALLLEAAA